MSNIMKALSKSEVNKLLSADLKSWSFDGTCLSRNFKFRNFVSAFSFMTAVAMEAEKMEHHPDWSNIYNTVNIRLNTHDVNGISQLDFDLAHIIERLSEGYELNRG
jgi:4a-hydroxytetrahydrobiopterin dehydratase